MKSTIFLTCYLFLSSLLFTQEIELLAIKTDKSINIDGLLNESIWKKAPDANVYLQEVPDREDADRLRTSVKILYDDDFIYFGFLCYDPEPEKLQAETLKIDGDLRDTDSIYILIDNLEDINNFNYFSTNFLGANWDGKISKDGQAVNTKWDGKWKAFGQKTDFGWSAEVVIERSCIFENPRESKTLGLCLARIVPRTDTLFRSGPLDPPFDFDQIKPMKELNLVEPEMGGNLNPFVITELESGAKAEPGAGIDARYAFSQQMSGRLSVNPDFATIEPDQERINLTPYELYLPEKREFFLENSGFQQQQFNLFYSKRIGNILGGAKLHGSTGAYEFSGMSVQTKKDDDVGEDSANFTVLFLERKGMARSLSIGFIAANKFINKKNIGTTGVYTNLYITDKFRLSGQFALSYGNHSKGNLAFFLGPSYDSKTFHIHLQYIQIGEYFGDNVNHVGFIPDDNRRGLDSSINKAFPFKDGIFKQIRYRSNYNIFWGMDGTLRKWQINQGLFFDLKSNFIISISHTQEYMYNDYFPEPRLVRIPAKGYWDYSGPGSRPQFISTEPERWEEEYIKDFRNHRTTVHSFYNAGPWKSFGLSISAGRNFDSTFIMLEVYYKFKITEKLFSEYEFSFLQLDDEMYFNSTTLHVFKIIYYTNRNLTWKFFYQSNSGIDKKNFHIVCIYKLTPFSTIQLTYQKGTARFGEKGTQDHTLFLKLGFNF